MSDSKILIVDDDDDMRGLVRLWLKKNHSVYEASNGEEALEAIRNIRPELCLLDLNLPDISGADILKTVRSNEELSGMKVLILSGTEENELPESLLEYRPEGIVSKSGGKRQLLDAVERILQEL